jgi:hypothetical protein
VPPEHRLIVVDHERQEILGVEDAGDVVERVAEHGEARVLGAAHAIHHLAPRRAELDAHDVDAWDHDVAHGRVREREDAVKERLLVA